MERGLTWDTPVQGTFQSSKRRAGAKNKGHPEVPSLNFWL